MGFSDPVFIASFGGAVAAGIGTWLIWRTKQQGNYRFFREDYRREIDPLLDHFYNFLSSRSWASWSLRPLFEGDPRMSKRILQHLYTCSDTKFLYDVAKEMAEQISEQEKQGVNFDKINSNLGKFTMDFHEKFPPIWNELKNSPNPDFGACEKCVKDIKLKHVQKHRKFLEKSDPKMWNFFERSESK